VLLPKSAAASVMLVALTPGLADRSEHLQQADGQLDVHLDVQDRRCRGLAAGDRTADPHAYDEGGTTSQLSAMCRCTIR
jgi:hypothetical protein